MKNGEYLNSLDSLRRILHTRSWGTLWRSSTRYPDRSRNILARPGVVAWARRCRRVPQSSVETHRHPIDWLMYSSPKCDHDVLVCTFPFSSYYYRTLEVFLYGAADSNRSVSWESSKNGLISSSTQKTVFHIVWMSRGGFIQQQSTYKKNSDFCVSKHLTSDTRTTE